MSNKVKKVKLIKIISTPPTSDKKYIAEFELLKEDGKKKIKKVGFGQKGAKDFTLMNKKGNKHYVKSNADRLRIKNAYRARHAKDLDTNNFIRPGYLSWWLLWNKPTFGKSMIAYVEKFNL
jgi:hypothetical protein